MATARLQQYDNATSGQATFEEVSDSHASAFSPDVPHSIRMSQRDFRLFAVAIDEDREPNDTLKAAAQRFKQKHG